MPASPALRGNLLCMASMLIWATAFPVADHLLKLMGPVPLTAFRVGIAAVFLLGLWVASEGRAALQGVPWGKAFVIGAFGYTLGAILLLAGQALSDPVTVTIVAAMMPLVGIAAEVVLDRRPLTLPLIVGLLLTLLGGYIATSVGSGPTFSWGAIIAAGSLFTYTWLSRETVKALPELTALGQTSATLIGAGVSAVVLAVLVAPLGYSSVAWGSIGTVEIGSLLVYGVGSVALSHLWWIKGVRHLGVGIASMHVNITPFYVMVFMVALGSEWNMMQAIGAAVVAVGVLAAQVKLKSASD
jgi:drug/metabolite transporter (DMT)-like permease